MDKIQAMETITIAYNKIISESSRSITLNCEGDVVLFPISQVKLDRIEKKVSMPAWLFKSKFPGEPIQDKFSTVIHIHNLKNLKT